MRLRQRFRAGPLRFLRTWVAIFGLAIYIVHEYTVVHPFLLADNRYSHCATMPLCLLVCPALVAAVTAACDSLLLLSCCHRWRLLFLRRAGSLCVLVDLILACTHACLQCCLLPLRLAPWQRVSASRSESH